MKENTVKSRKRQPVKKRKGADGSSTDRADAPQARNGQRSRNGQPSAKVKGVPSWVFVAVMVLGGLMISVVSYFWVSDALSSEPEPIHVSEGVEERFESAADVSYTVPPYTDVDWDAEFNKVDFQEDGNVSAVVVPSLGMYSELISSGAEDGSLVLPDAPQGTWYNRSVPLGSSSGNTVMSGHVNRSDNLEYSPWAMLHSAEPGALIGIRDTEGQVFVYEAYDMDVYPKEGLPQEIFRTDGDHVLRLVTCSGEIVEDPEALSGRRFEHNLVVSAKLVSVL